MPYIPDLEQVQIGTEVTWGTGVAGTVKLGLVEDCKLSPEVENKAIEEDTRGSLAPAYADAFMSHKGKGSLSGTLTYEDAPYLFDSALGTATPTGASPYVRNYLGALGSVPARRKLSVTNGQPGLVHRLTGGIVSKLGVSGETGGVIKYSADLIGKKIEAAWLTALSDRTLSPVLAQNGALYIDAEGGTVGTTLINSTWFDFDLSIETGADLYMGIGSLYAVGYREAKNKSSLKMSIEADATSLGYLNSLLTANVKKQIRLKFSKDANNILQMDFAGMFKGVPELYNDKDGVIAFEFELDAIYNTHLANWFAASITNPIATLA